MLKQTHIGESFTIHGNLYANEDLVFNGKLEGEQIECYTNTLVISEKSEVKANLHAKVIVIIGTVNGDIKADKMIQLADTAYVRGTLEAPVLDIAEGADYTGHITLVKAAKAS